jgi:hypothetical protein
MTYLIASYRSSRGSESARKASNHAERRGRKVGFSRNRIGP